MTVWVAGALVIAIAAVVIVAALAVRRRGRTTAVLVACDPEAALLGSAVALRRLGARITRYDSEDGTLEATVAAGDGRVRLRACPNGTDATLVEVEGDPRARRVVQRFRGALSV
jgi:hypothetical protein